MLYHASLARLKPLVRPLRSSCSGKSDGVLEMNHDLGSDTSMPLFVFSKSSMYDASSCVPPACPAMSCANSPVNDICDGCVRWRKGSLSSMLVSHWLSFFQLRLRPQSMLLSGSEPMVTFDVSGCSWRRWNVPPMKKSLVKSYSKLMPNIVLRVMPKSVLLSRLTFTLVPASMILWLSIVTSPAE